MKMIAIKVLIAILLATFITVNVNQDLPEYAQFHWGIEQAHATF